VSCEAGGQNMPRMKIEPGRLTLYLVLTFTGSAAIWVSSSISTVVHEMGWVVLMWIPGTAAVMTCWIRREPLRELGWTWRPWRYQLASFFLPLGLSIGVYGLAWISSPAMFDGTAGIARRLPLGLWLTLMVVFNMNLALGEEIGWRGLLVPELARKFGLAGTSWLTGAIWTAWHLPLIIFYGFGGDAPLAYRLFWALTLMVSMSFALTWLRRRSGSLWTAAILHGTHNLVVQDLLDPMTADTRVSSFVLGEFGFALPLAWAGVAMVIWRATRSVQASAPARESALAVGAEKDQGIQWTGGGTTE
jgi:membrane protease YdiL (CAAX protease family)